MAGACTADAKVQTQLVIPEDYGGANLAPSVMVLTSKKACKRLEKMNAFYFFIAEMSPHIGGTGWITTRLNAYKTCSPSLIFFFFASVSTCKHVLSMRASLPYLPDHCFCLPGPQKP